MNVEYYAYALFVAGLVCLVAILFKVLFADVRRQKKLLDEKESKLLQLYQSVESIMDEFNDQYRAVMDEMESRADEVIKKTSELETLTARHATAVVETYKQTQSKAQQERFEPFERLQRADAPDNGRIRAAGEALARVERIIKSDDLKKTASPQKKEEGPVFQRLFDEIAEETFPQQTQEQEKVKIEKKDTIIALAEEGKSEGQIARELGITRNEVQLIIGLTKTR